MFPANPITGERQLPKCLLWHLGDTFATRLPMVRLSACLTSWTVSYLQPGLSFHYPPDVQHSTRHF